jgi:hypothetical protein
LLGRSGFLINSHDPLRGHVLKHIRQNSLTRLRYSVADEGMKEQKTKTTPRWALPTMSGKARPTKARARSAPKTAFEFLSPERRRVAQTGQGISARTV